MVPKEIPCLEPKEIPCHKINNIMFAREVFRNVHIIFVHFKHFFCIIIFMRSYSVAHPYKTFINY
jgi:hypothetical protein